MLPQIFTKFHKNPSDVSGPVLRGPLRRYMTSFMLFVPCFVTIISYKHQQMHAVYVL
jgi:hypothetical protein